MMGIRSPSNGIKRPHNRKETKPRTLIVYGAQCSEKYYIENLLAHHDISSSTVMTYDFAFTPERLVKEAQTIAKTEVRNGEIFDEVFCIVDRDDFAHFDVAKQAAIRSKFNYIESHPCFEYWLLIHFKPTDKPFASMGKVSIGEACKKELKTYYKTYEKNSRTIYSDLFDKVGDAITYAERRYKKAESENDYNPCTNFYLLIRHLLKQKKK